MVNPAIEYARDVVTGKEDAGKYVKLQCEVFLRDCDGESETYFFNEKKFKKITKLLTMLKMARGPMARRPVAEALSGYQWLLIAAGCIQWRGHPTRRRYQIILLEIGRKNGKTFIVAILFIIYFYTEPTFSKFFSVAPNGQLAKEIKEAIDPLITVNEDVFDNAEWKVTRDYILHTPNSIRYVPLNCANSTLDGREPAVFIADEVGALPTNYPIEAMRSGQILVDNPIGFIISTKYPSINNPLEEEVASAKKVLEGVKRDDSLFALLYEPDNPKKWKTDDSVLVHANPLMVHSPRMWERLLKYREEAIERPALRENFLTKHCNIIYQGLGTEVYIDLKYVQPCRVDHIDWRGREVFVAADLSESGDNTSVSMVSMGNGLLLAHSMCFVPYARVEEKSKREKVDYKKYIREGTCIACGDETIDYAAVNDYVMHMEERYGVTIRQIGYDPWNCRPSAQIWSEKYETVEIKQHSSVLHSATKLLYEQIVNGNFIYETNELLEINFQNARCVYDTNRNRYVNKMKSSGKVDMVVSLINALHLLQVDSLNNMNFVIQTF